MIAIPTVSAQNCNKRCNCCEAQQKHRHHKKSAAERVEHLNKRLNLTDEQAQKIESIFTEFDKEQEKIQDRNRDEMKKRRDKMDKEIEKVLTEEQLKIYKEKRRTAPNR